MKAIETERLILRKFHASDAEAVYNLYTDGEAMDFLHNCPYKNAQEAAKELSLYEDRFDDPSRLDAFA